MMPLLRWLSASVLLAAAATTGYALLRVAPVEAMEIRWVDVTGPFQRVSAEQIRAAAVPHLERGFLAADPEAVRKAVERLAWVRSAEVTKDWPDTVHIRIAEHEPLARWGDGRLISENGQLFTVEPGMVPAGLPELAGPDAHAVEIVVFHREMQKRLVGTGFDVRRLARSARGGWSAQLGDGFTLELGVEAPLERLTRFLSALGQLEALPGRELIGADLRYGNGFSVRWREVEATPLREPVATETLIAARHEG